MTENTCCASQAFAFPAALSSQGYRLRPETQADLPFLFQLYTSTRAAELAQVPWTDEQRAAFLAQQFGAQRNYYRQTIANCRFDVVEKGGVPIGRFYLQEQPSRLHIVDIALMPAWRGQGIGTQILSALHEAAYASGRDVGIMVEAFNPALALYRRLGYRPVKDHGVYLEMEWSADAAG